MFEEGKQAEQQVFTVVDFAAIWKAMNLSRVELSFPHLFCSDISCCANFWISLRPITGKLSRLSPVGSIVGGLVQYDDERLKRF